METTYSAACAASTSRDVRIWDGASRNRPGSDYMMIRPGHLARLTPRFAQRCLIGMQEILVRRILMAHRRSGLLVAGLGTVLFGGA